jgi:hypothetical protein
MSVKGGPSKRRTAMIRRSELVCWLRVLRALLAMGGKRAYTASCSLPNEKPRRGCNRPRHGRTLIAQHGQPELYTTGPRRTTGGGFALGSQRLTVLTTILTTI